jgi:hypothetical protein
LLERTRYAWRILLIGYESNPRDFIQDDVIPSAEGATAIADVLADLGYEPVAP